MRQQDNHGYPRTGGPSWATALVVSILLHGAAMLVVLREGRMEPLAKVSSVKINLVEIPRLKKVSKPGQAQPLRRRKKKATRSRPKETTKDILPPKEVLTEEKEPEEDTSETEALAAQSGSNRNRREYTKPFKLFADFDELDNASGFKPAFKVKPIYPSFPLKANIEGFVVLQLTVGEDGAIRDYRVVDWRGHHTFQEAVEKVIRKWRFPIPRRNGRPTLAKGLHTVQFQIDWGEDAYAH